MALWVWVWVKIRLSSLALPNLRPSGFRIAMSLAKRIRHEISYTACWLSKRRSLEMPIVNKQYERRYKLIPYLADEVVFVFVSVVFSRQMVEHGSRSPSLYSEIVFIAV